MRKLWERLATKKMIALLLVVIMVAILIEPLHVLAEDAPIDVKPGTISVTSNVVSSSDISTMTEYDYNSAMISGKFTVKYTPESVTNHTVLVISLPKYGMKWDMTINNQTKPESIVDAYRISDTQYAVLLRDGISGDVFFDVLATSAELSYENAATWMDEGHLPKTNFVVDEFYFPNKTLYGNSDLAQIDYATEGKVSSFQLFPQDIEFVNLTSEESIFESTFTYNMHMPSVPELFNIYASENGIGGKDTAFTEYEAGHNFIYRPSSEKPCPFMGYKVNAFGPNGVPFAEIKSIKLYLPDDRLELTGIADYDYSNPNISTDSGSTVRVPGYEMMSDWIVGERQKDDHGYYYMITPSEGNRLFNTSDALKGFRPLWKVSDVTKPLDNSEDDEVHYIAADTVVTYAVIRNQTVASESYSHKGSAIDIYKKVEYLPYVVFDRKRGKNLYKGYPVVVGQNYKDTLVYMVNTHQVRTSHDSGKYGEEFIPKYADLGGVTETIEFPYEIQPSAMRLFDGVQEAFDENDGVKLSRLESVRYILKDNTEKTVSQDVISQVNEQLTKGKAITAIIPFEDTTDTNPVLKVIVHWSHYGTRYHKQDWSVSTDSTINNVLIQNQFLNSQGVNSAFTSALEFDYHVSTVDADGNTITEGMSVQGTYRAEFEKEELKDHVITESNPTDISGMKQGEYLYWYIDTPGCPVIAEYAINNMNGPRLDAEHPEVNVGSLYFKVNTPNETMKEVQNPVINLKSYTSGSYYQLNNGTNMVGMTDSDAMAFVSNHMTVSRHLSGWVFTYTTNLSAESKTYVVPTTTEETQDITIPLLEDEYFKTISLAYNGNYIIDCDSEQTKYDLITKVNFRYLDTNPFTGEKLQNSSWNNSEYGKYSDSYILLAGEYSWENCSCGKHHPSKPTLPWIDKDSYSYLNASVCYNYRMDISWYFGNPAMSKIDDTAYQGETVRPSVKMYFTMDSFCYSAKPVGREYYQPYASKAYIELVDDDFDPEPYLKYFSIPGIKRGQNNVTATVKSIANKRYVVIENLNPTRDTAETSTPLEMMFGISAIASTQKHYPIGKVYLDYTDTIEYYSIDEGIEGKVPTDIQVKNGVTVPELSEYPMIVLDFSKDTTLTDPVGATLAYNVDVLKVATIESTHYPSKNAAPVVKSVNTVTFNETERNALNAHIIWSSDVDLDFNNVEMYFNVPKKGDTVTYLDENNRKMTKSGEYNMYLTKQPEIVSFGEGNEDIQYTFYYTTDSNPTKNSTYTSVAPTTEEGWNKVTGVKITANLLKVRKTDFDILVSYSADKKDTMKEQIAYSCGDYVYSHKGVKNEGKFSLIQWNYSAVEPVEVTIPAKLTITGDTPENPSDFTFILNGENDAPMPVDCKEGTRPVTITGEGIIDLGAITFPELGTYNYTVKQVVGNDVDYDYEYDTTTYNITVEVTVGADGETAEAVTTIRKDGENGTSESAAFENVYSAPVGDLKITNNAVDPNVSADKAFPFTVTFTADGAYEYAIGNTTGTVKSGDNISLKAGESVVISNLPKDTEYEVKLADIEGYTVNAAGETGTIPKKDTVEAVYEITRDMINLTAVVIWDDEDDKNGVRPEYVTAEIRRGIEGETPTVIQSINFTEENQWTKQLEPLEACDDDGNPYIYTMVETPEPNCYEVTYSVENETTLIATNKEVAPSEVTFTPEAIVTLDGEIPEDTYSFTITEIGTLDRFGDEVTANEYEEVVTNTDKDIVFSTITYTEEGTHVYQITENDIDDPTVAKDNSVYEVTVKVTRDQTNNCLETDIVIIKNEEDEVNACAFDNRTYIGVIYSIPGEVIVTGDPEKDETFVVNAVSDALNPTDGGTEELSVIGSGEIPFSEITFNQPGIYAFTVTETPGTDENYEYDSKEYLVTVIVTVGNDGVSLEAAASIVENGEEPKECEKVVFTNIYTAPVVEPEEPEKPVVTEVPENPTDQGESGGMPENPDSNPEKTEPKPSITPVPTPVETPVVTPEPDPQPGKNPTTGDATDYNLLSMMMLLAAVFGGLVIWEKRRVRF